MSVPVGIDIGTSNSCACFYRNGTYEIFTVESGNRLLPSYVCYDEKGNIVVGESAEKKVDKDGCFTVCSFKRVLGRSFKSKEVKEMEDRCIAPLRESTTGEVEFYDADKNKSYAVCEITAELIKGILQIVVRNSGLQIGDVTFTVPAYFTPHQREVMEQAIKKAGIADDHYCIITEPTAAAISYGVDNDIKSKIFLVYDLGGGTFDVSVMRITPDSMSVINHDGDNFLGGESFDAAIFEHVIKIAEKDYHHSPLPPQNHKRYLQKKKKLLMACEEVKKGFVYGDSGYLDLTPYASYLQTDMEELFVSLSQADLDNLLNPFMKQAIHVIDRAILDAGLTKNDVDAVVLVGGSTRLKCVRSSLQKYFGNRISLQENVNPDEAVAKGACLFCTSWMKNKAQPTLTWYGRVLTMDEVTASSIGIGGSDDRYYCVIPKYSVKNGKKYRKRLRKSSDACTEQFLYVYQGDDPVASKNQVLKKISWQGFPDYPAQYVYFDLFLSIEKDGCIYADVIDVRTNEVYLDHFLVQFIVSSKHNTSQGIHYSSIECLV